MPASTSTTGLLKHYGRASMCVCMWVCGIKRHRVHIGALQKSYLQRSEKRPPLYSPPHYNTHIHTQQTRPPTAQSSTATQLCCTLHTQTHPHTCDSLVVFKVQRTGNHYESVPLTPTLRDEKLCVFHCNYTATQIQRKLLNLLLTNTNNIYKRLKEDSVLTTVQYVWSLHWVSEVFPLQKLL